MKKLIDITAIKFILVGVVNTLVGTLVMFVFYNGFGFGYWFSSASNYVIGSIVSYFLNKYFTFKDTGKSWKTVAKFIVNITICYGLAYGLAKPAVYYLLSGSSASVRDNLAMVVGMGLFVVFNYFGQRFLVFTNQKAHTESSN